MSAGLIVRNDSALSVSVPNESLELKSVALANASLVVAVSNPQQQEAAVECQTEIHQLLADVEKTRKDIKAPVLDFGRKIDDCAKRFCAELEAEQLRIAKLLGDYQALELAKARSEQAARNEELSELERRREAELAQSPSLEAREDIYERFNQEVAALGPAAAPARAEGQVVREDWDFLVVDIQSLARNHPNLVKIEPRRAEIKAALSAGLFPSGVKAWSITRSSVRVPKKQEVMAA